MPDDDSVVSEVVKGATRATLDYSEDKVKGLVKRFLQGDLAFIEDEETIEIVRTQRQKPEWKIYRNYITTPDLRMQIEMGFSLKQLQNNQIKLHNLRNKIVKKYNRKGLHVAELAQSGVLGRYIGLLLGHTEDENDLKEGIEEILEAVDKYVIFLKLEDDEGDAGKTIVDRIRILSPRAIILFSCSPRVVKKAENIIKAVKKKIKGYVFEVQLEETTCQRYDFILKQPTDYSALEI
ncbi:MAG: hypothetical protein V1494_07805 [Candidatus Diapherotrites archaeon]